MNAIGFGAIFPTIEEDDDAILSTQETQTLVKIFNFDLRQILINSTIG